MFPEYKKEAEDHLSKAVSQFGTIGVLLFDLCVFMFSSFDAFECFVAYC